MMNYSEIYDLAKEFEEELADTIEDLEKIIDKLKIIKYQLDELQKERYEIR